MGYACLMGENIRTCTKPWHSDIFTPGPSCSKHRELNSVRLSPLVSYISTSKANTLLFSVDKM